MASYGQDASMNSRNSAFSSYEIFDFLFPGSNSAKLVKAHDAYARNFPYQDILKRLGLAEGYPVVNIIGGLSRNEQPQQSKDRVKLYNGITRACYSTDAVIIDSGIASGVEKHVARKGVKLIGVAPENEIQYPKVNSTQSDPMELSSGHTHIFLVNNPEDDLQWTQETLFRATLALKIAEGDYQRNGVYQRVVNILIGDSPHYIDDIKFAVKYQQPILIVPGSKLANSIIESFSNGMTSFKGISEELVVLLSSHSQYFFLIVDPSSDQVAQYVHFFLTVTPFKQSVPLIYQQRHQLQPQQQNSQSILEQDEFDTYQVKSDQRQQQNYEEDDGNEQEQLRGELEAMQINKQQEASQQQSSQQFQQSLQLSSRQQPEESQQKLQN